MTQKLIIYDDEYSGKSKADSKIMKQLLSASIFSMRAPYGRKNMDYKRLAMLCGSANEDEILNDPTGNRRLIVIKLEEMIDWEIYNDINKDQLFAQSYYLYLQGENSKISKEDKDLMDKYTFEEHYETTMESELLHKFFEIGESKKDTFITTSEIMVYLKDKTREHSLYFKRLGQELRRAGFIRDYTNRKWGYWVKYKNLDASNERKVNPDSTIEHNKATMPMNYIDDLPF
jgi:predicted P-loop ATPase